MESFASIEQKCKQPENQENLKTKFAFFLFGFVISAVNSTLMVAALDILSATLLPTTVVLLGQSLPFFVISIVCPFFIMKVKVGVRIAVVFASFSSGLLLISLAEHVGWKLVGVYLVAVGDGVGDMTILALTAFYHHVVVGAYASGSGLSSCMVPLFYLGLTTLMCVPPMTAVLGTIILLPLYPLMYIVMDKKGNTEIVTMEAQHSQVRYTRLSTQPDEEETRQSLPTLSLTEKLILVWKSFPLVYSLAVGHISKYLSFQSVATVLAFPDAPFGPRNLYVFYITTAFAGVFIGRSYGVIWLSIKPSISPYTKHTGIFSTLMFTILIFLIFAAWYRFVPSVWIVMSLMFLVGVLEGALMVCTFSVAGEEENFRPKTEFLRAFLTSGIAVGFLAAAFLGLSTETLLRAHCIDLLTSPEYCLTRSPAPWNATLSCRM